ncbi:MAG: peptidoglycan-binding domain-containing protein [Alphaproteobacteria bacterium]
MSKSMKVNVRPEQQGQYINTYTQDESGNFQKSGEIHVSQIAPAELSSEEIGKRNAYEVPEANANLAEVQATKDQSIVMLTTSEGPVAVKMDDLAIQNSAQKAELVAQSQSMAQQFAAREEVIAHRQEQQPAPAAPAPPETPEVASATVETQPAPVQPEPAQPEQVELSAADKAQAYGDVAWVNPPEAIKPETIGKPQPTQPATPAAPTAPAAVEAGGILARAGEIGPRGYLSDLDPVEVVALQTKLQEAGYDLGPAGTDGKLGKDTMAAARQYVAANNLSENITLAELGEHTTAPQTELAQAAPEQPAAENVASNEPDPLAAVRELYANNTQEAAENANTAPAQDGMAFTNSIKPFDLTQQNIIPPTHEIVPTGNSAITLSFDNDGVNHVNIDGQPAANTFSLASNANGAFVQPVDPTPAPSGPTVAADQRLDTMNNANLTFSNQV